MADLTVFEKLLTVISRNDDQVIFADLEHLERLLYPSIHEVDLAVVARNDLGQ
jgi:hypothetical protein